MPLTTEQIHELKKQLSEQIQHLPEEQRATAQKQIDEMSPQSLELMIHQQQQSQQEIFRLILEGKIPSVKLSENQDAIAVLDIKPISEGHTIIIPKNRIKNISSIPEKANQLASEISDKLKQNLNAKSILIEPEAKFSEIIINVIPIYDKPLTLSSQRTESTPEKLQELSKKITKEVIKKKAKKEIIKRKKKSGRKKVLKLDRRIP